MARADTPLRRGATDSDGQFDFQPFPSPRTATMTQVHNASGLHSSLILP